MSIYYGYHMVPLLLCNINITKQSMVILAAAHMRMSPAIFEPLVTTSIFRRV